MAKEKKTPKNPKENSSDITKYIFLAVFVILIGYFLYTLIKKEDLPEKKNTVIDPQERIKNVKEPPFMKEGQLEFISNDKKTEIKGIDIEIAENDGERMQGLMYRKGMDDSKGMLFIFDKEEPQAFWMKNTIMSLDIIYVNSKKEIVKIFKNTVPFSEKSLPSEKPAIFVVEVGAGFTDRYGIKDGDIINFKKSN
ncbi:MAG: DUF192 domain-containing protein [Ignavibacteria bacterium]